ncbi:hypothetical protein CCACVL1_24248, partial [Corchorus capsularis]
VVVDLRPALLFELRPGIRAYVTARVARKWKSILRGASDPVTADLIFPLLLF